MHIWIRAVSHIISNVTPHATILFVLLRMPSIPTRLFAELVL